MDALIDAPLRGAASSTPPTAAHAVLGPDELTAGELRVLRLLVGGATNREIASCAEISENTVKFHLKNVYGKLGVSSRAAAVFAAVQRGLVASA
ncbi:helix-turn-helix domain-containing protein [Sinimarinibacterium thermocellulolyticum]|uniref:LuxR C-terminal-related transcriptional regulator n=1 Tax=Sinimarinibacterium thermocellulolyticum TaxID=3170016 RepID=A0ABV2A624_9GAMM